MKTKLISFFCFSLSFAAFGQKKPADTIKKPWKYEPNFFVSVDVLNAGLGAFSDHKLFQAGISSRLTKKLHVSADVGYDKNVYQKNGYDAKASGNFFKLGSYYMLSQDKENLYNGFYAGGKLAGSFYKQEYFAIPVRATGGGADGTQSLPESSQSSYWLEAVIGGRVELFNSNFYIDVNVQPKYLLHTSKQEEVFPMIVPGFGRSSGKFGFGFSWNIAYKF
ncbi:DUF6048 family protein [Soonwooa sp.]|uniref:DUF6048 family protein n=1 Tax=Soonwooa sp. TaxID=1938592 RepID=UPI0026279CCF|nr:DUF6048 family protein [Soonwooa sp.]